MLGQTKFYSFVREERLFCATFAHLLMQKGPNLATFLNLLNNRLTTDLRISTNQLEEAEIYPEFTFLRDHWNDLKDNEKKRSRIFELLSRVEGLRGYKSEHFTEIISEFNGSFMGDRGRRILNDIVYPGQWNVGSLQDTFINKLGATPQVFRDFCKFKWAFNIKPDLVMLIPGSRPVCIEAKLESREGWYPTANLERRIFDRLFGTWKGRVRQIELQRFMFEVLLDDPCISVFIGRAPESGNDPFLSWDDIFTALDLDSSIPYIRRLVEQNIHLKPFNPAQGAGN